MVYLNANIGEVQMDMSHDESVAILFCIVCFCVAALAIPAYRTREEAVKRATHYFDALQKVLGKPYPQFVLTEKDKNFLIEHNYSPEALYHLVVLIMLHLKMPYTKFQINVRDGTGLKTAGQYSSQPWCATIEVQVRPYFTGDQVIAIVCHECAHHFLRVKKIKGRNTEINELLTDYATIFIGFGELMKKGYAQMENRTDGGNMLTKVGYISEYEIKVAMELLPTYLKGKA